MMGCIKWTRQKFDFCDEMKFDEMLCVVCVGRLWSPHCWRGGWWPAALQNFILWKRKFVDLLVDRRHGCLAGEGEEFFLLRSSSWQSVQWRFTFKNSTVFKLMATNSTFSIQLPVSYGSMKMKKSTAYLGSGASTLQKRNVATDWWYIGEGSRSRNRATIIISVISAGSGKKEFRWDQKRNQRWQYKGNQLWRWRQNNDQIRDNSYKIIGIRSSEERGRGEAQIPLKHIIHNAKVPVHQMMR